MTAETLQPHHSVDRPTAGSFRTYPASSLWRDRNGRATRFLLPARPVHPVFATRAARQIASFALIGGVSTIAYVLLYALLQEKLPDAVANAIALVITAVGNTAANRRLTFAVEGRDGLARDHAAGLLALAVALAITTASLAGLHLAVRTPSRDQELVVLVAANVLATVARFLLLRFAMARPTLAAVPERIDR